MKVEVLIHGYFVISESAFPVFEANTSILVG